MADTDDTFSFSLDTYLRPFIFVIKKKHSGISLNSIGNENTKYTEDKIDIYTSFRKDQNTQSLVGNRSVTQAKTVFETLLFNGGNQRRALSN